MSLAMTIFSMIAAWIAIAIALLWGMLRIARRHQSTAQKNVGSDVRSQRGQHMPQSISLKPSSI